MEFHQKKNERKESQFVVMVKALRLHWVILRKEISLFDVFNSLSFIYGLLPKRHFVLPTTSVECITVLTTRVSASVNA